MNRTSGRGWPVRLPGQVVAMLAAVLLVAGAAHGWRSISRAQEPDAAITAGAGAAGEEPATTVVPEDLPAPDCTVPATPTPAQTEGPYYKAGSPERSSLLEPGMAGTRLVITGYVLDTDCRPIAGAKLDFWQADDAGRYDNSGYTLRGHVFTDANGRYAIETIVPGLYPGRTRHIHVKVQAPGKPALTTQLYLPDEPGNARDGIFRPGLVMQVQANPDGNGLLATFTFVLNAG
jgi:protocatechuate 3,4-dioxygenase beta subunit